ncbi:serine/threonine-protein kinase [Kitasatospora aureofaciens]|uniref:serine/threonine-protein kinase n=1 Tax=Kitasatospora aureofaciens TaxID=1894 RepID=UPI0027E0A234|nr:serine/threonine-protein kinase [Kitasatospora aureofaciens]
MGAYRLVGRIGSGGMGRVYLGRTVSGRLVAVKTLLAEGMATDEDRRRFAREVALARRVTGLYTVAVVDADAEAPVPWMATEYVPAPSLAELVKRAGPLHPPAAVRRVAAGMAEALADLHRSGVVHRDVKPANVLLPTTGPRLIDFGISHATDLTRTSLTLGTIAYTSPEQARGEASVSASDVYSTGATLFHLAVGRPPYADTSDTLRLLGQVQRGELDLAGLPSELDGLVRACLALDPADRPTPAELLADFRSTADEPGGVQLPEPWTALIREYQERVHEPAVPAAERPTRLRPAWPTKTRVLPAGSELETARLAAPPPEGSGRHPRRTRPRALLAALVVAAAGILAVPSSTVHVPLPADPAVDAAFQQLGKGDCVDSVFGPDGFSPAVPRQVDCGADDAYLIVRNRTTDENVCDSGAGEETWSNGSERTADRLFLCVRRQFRVGECVPTDVAPTPGPVRSEDMWQPHPCGGAAGRELVIAKVTPVDAQVAQGAQPSPSTAELCGSGDYWRFDGPDAHVCLERPRT